jgi:hypothetical protein
MSTARQRISNQLNSKLSTGPRSDQGKLMSRRNALKHGLSGAGIVLPDEEQAAIKERVEHWNSSLRPFEVIDLWLVEDVATEAVRVERCRAMEAETRAEDARRADESWDDDRRLAAEKRAAGLARRPEVVSRELAATLQGLELLLERWGALAAALEKRDWNEAERSLALDLMGVPRALREAPTAVDVDADGRRRLVAERVAGLESRRPMLEERDGREQAAAMLGLGEPSDALKRLRRYESACHRRLQWAYGRLKAVPRNTPRAPFPYAPDPKPDPAPDPYVSASVRLTDSLPDDDFDDEPELGPAPPRRVPRTPEQLELLQDLYESEVFRAGPSALWRDRPGNLKV